MQSILFICGKARKRSPTAAELASRLLDTQADYAGLSADADVCLGRDQIDAADVIAVMERPQLARLRRKFGPALRCKRLICLDVPDTFEFGEPALIELLSERFLRLSSTSKPHQGQSECGKSAAPVSGARDSQQT